VPEVSLIIPVWDNLELTKTCVTQFLHCTESDLEVIVIDNGSTDWTWRWLSEVAEVEPRLRIIHNDINLGYGPALNQGLMAAFGEYLVCLNNDVVVLHPNWLEILIAPLRENHNLICGGRLITGSNSLNVDGWIPAYLEGYCLAFHRQFLTDVGFLDDEFAPAFVEDVEICWRAERHGYMMREVRTPLHHLYGRTTYQTHAKDTPHQEITRRNIEYFRKKVRGGNDTPFYPEGWVPEVS
jgi:GT2 family glycosyltransferase